MNSPARFPESDSDYVAYVWVLEGDGDVIYIESVLVSADEEIIS